MTVNAAYYRQFLQKLRRKMHANRPDLLEHGVLNLRDNARPTLLRMSVNCWMDTAERCYPIRPTALTWVPRTSTSSQNWKSTCVVCVSRRWRNFLPPLPDASDSSTVQQTWRVSWTFQNVGKRSFGRRDTTLKDYNTLPHIRYSYPVDIAFCAFLLKCNTATCFDFYLKNLYQAV